MNDKDGFLTMIEWIVLRCRVIQHFVDPFVACAIQLI